MNRYFFVLITVFYLHGCSVKVEQVEKYPDIFPDYRDVVIPVNIAPLNFGIADSFQRIEVRFMQNGRLMLKCSGRRKISIPAGKWKDILSLTAGSDMQVHVAAKRAGRWYAYRQFSISVTPDSIDPYIAYRLIDPGYEIWCRMGIYQRNLSNFDQSVIITNRLNGKGCVNCHSFHNYSPDRMMFHSRGEKYAGTFLYADGQQKRVETKTGHAPGAATYPAWHPSGNYIAFSSNVTRQTFHVLPGKKVEVYDLESDLTVLDIKNSAMLRDARFTTAGTWETFPSWSPDGEWLYYCYAAAVKMPFDSEHLKYGLCRVQFDASTGRFTSAVDTLLNPQTYGRSVSHPRISPDGRYLLYTVSGYATFPIWHSEADLAMLDLHGNTPVDIQTVNSDQSESYHAWSSNGRWIVFSSRRIDGLYTRPYFAYFDASSKMHKPFLLPQKDPDYYSRSLQSFNIPEFVRGKSKLNPYEISRTLNGEITDLNEIIY